MDPLEHHSHPEILHCKRARAGRRVEAASSSVAGRYAPVGDAHRWAAGEQPAMEEVSAATCAAHSPPPTVKTDVVLRAGEGI